MKKSSLLIALRISFLFFFADAAALQTLAVLISYEKTSHYFGNYSFISTLAVICSVLSAVLGTVAVLMSKKEELYPNIFERATFPNPMAGGAIAAALLFGGYRLLSAGYSSTPSTFDLCIIICLLVTMVYAILTGIQNVAGQKTLAAFFGLFAIVAGILLNAYYYFDRSIEMNAPLKTSVQVGLLFATLYLTAEVRYLLGTQMPKMMQILAACTVSFGALSALAIPVAFFTEKLNRPDYLAGALFVLGFVPTALIRLQTLRYLPQPPPASPEEKTE